NGGDDLTVNANGAFQFATSLPDESAYAVTVATQPGSPAQTCTVANGSGTLAGADVSNVSVTCVTPDETESYNVGGTVSGLAGTGLVLLLNGIELPVENTGTFQFPTPLPNGTSYTITVQAQPAGQTCTLTNSNGTLADEDIDNVGVTCTTEATSSSIYLPILAR
ncbi:MAG: hypothetical protein WDZ49_12615, partial [Litorilinea sp.]